MKHMTKSNCSLQPRYIRNHDTHDKTKLLTAITIPLHFLLSTPTQFQKASTLVTFSIIYNSHFFTTFHYPLHNFKRLSLQHPVAHALFSQCIIFLASRSVFPMHYILTSRSVIPMRIILSPRAPQIPASCLLCFYMTHHTTHAIANVHSPAPSISFLPMPFFSRSNLSITLDSTCTPSIFPMHIIRIFCSPSPV